MCCLSWWLGHVPIAGPFAINPPPVMDSMTSICAGGRKPLFSAA